MWRCWAEKLGMRRSECAGAIACSRFPDQKHTESTGTSFMAGCFEYPRSCWPCHSSLLPITMDCTSRTVECSEQALGLLKCIAQAVRCQKETAMISMKRSRPRSRGKAQCDIADASGLLPDNPHERYQTQAVPTSKALFRLSVCLRARADCDPACG